MEFGEQEGESGEAGGTLWACWLHGTVRKMNGGTCICTDYLTIIGVIVFGLCGGEFDFCATRSEETDLF